MKNASGNPSGRPAAARGKDTFFQRMASWRALIVASLGVPALFSLLGAAEPSGADAIGPQPSPSPAAAVTQGGQAPMEVPELCLRLRAEISALHWKIDPCQGIDWKVGGRSVNGLPLLYAEFGNPASDNTTLVMAAVHGDEVTPVYFGIELAHWMKDHEAEFSHAHVVIAPLVNPDGFFRKPRTRMNARGVDVNRNFLTSDWRSRALAEWRRRHHSDPRRFPGNAPRSEPETLFQESLIREARPQKILSIHSPLSHLDYDGPNILSLRRFPRDYVHECLKLKRKLKAVSTGYFPGSLGNFAGKELGIPTLTLELPSADPRKAEVYWRRFSKGIKMMIEFMVPSFASREIPPHG